MCSVPNIQINLAKKNNLNSISVSNRVVTDSQVNLSQTSCDDFSLRDSPVIGKFVSKIKYIKKLLIVLKTKIYFFLNFEHVHINY